MRFLLDTNVISEWVKPRPSAAVVAWLGATDEDRLFVSVITLGELRRGVEKLAAGARRTGLDAWLRYDLPERFEGRVVGVDAQTADAWGRIVADRERQGRRLGAIDALVAATAVRHELTLVTRNTRDFEPTVAALANPWESPAARMPGPRRK